MPPKKRRDGFSNDPLRQTRGFSLDAREMEVVEKLEPQVQNNWNLQRRAQQSLVGYAVLDLIEHSDSLKFGTWNSRELKMHHVRSLQASFRHNGLDRFDERSVVPLVIKKEVLDDTSLVQTIPSDVSKIPELKFVASQETIRCAGGRHRFEALKRHLAEIKDAFDEVARRRDQIAETSDDELSKEDIQYFNHESVKELERLGGILHYKGKWLVAVFNETSVLADGIELAQYLSRNETRHVYMETDDERIIMDIQLLATLPEDKRAERLRELRNRNSIAKKANPLIGVVSSEPVFKATEYLVNFSSYFLNMPEMNVKWLFNQLCGIHGGLLCVAIEVMAEKLHLCLTDTVLKLEDADKLVEAQRGDPNFPAFRQKIAELRKAKKVEDLKSLLPEMLSTVNEVWDDSIQTSAADAVGCMTDYEYVSSFDQYVTSATSLLLQLFERSQIRDLVKTVHHPVMDSIAAKFKLVCLDRTSLAFGLPILTRGPLVMLARHFGRIPLVLKEVTRWFDPLVDYQVAFSKSPNTAYTQAAIDALKQCSSLIKGCPANTLLLQTILNHYGDCLQLEVALPRYLSQHTQRVRTSGELTSIFPSRSDKDKDGDTPTDETSSPQGHVLAKRLRSRQKELLKLERQKEEQLAKLERQRADLTKAMNVACKPNGAIPFKHSSNLKLLGAYLLLHSSWNWQSIPSNSRSREFRNIAGAAVLEYNIIAEYRNELIESVPAASCLRLALTAAFNPFVKNPRTLLNYTSAAAVAPPQFSFADQIPHSPSSETFAISDTLPSWTAYQDRLGDQGVVQKIVWVVEKCPLAWQDPHASSKSPELDKGVQNALEKLVKELEKNAYRKRSGDTEADFTEDADAEDENASGVDQVNLGIGFRGCDTKSLLPKSQTARTEKKSRKPGRLLPQLSNKVPAVPDDEEAVDTTDPPAIEDGSEVVATVPSVETDLDEEQDPATKIVTTTRDQADQPQGMLHEAQSSIQELHSSPILTQVRKSSRDSNPAAPQSYASTSSPAARYTRRSSGASASKTGGSKSKQQDLRGSEPKSKRTRDSESDEIGFDGGKKKRAKKSTKFAQS